MAMTDLPTLSTVPGSTGAGPAMRIAVVSIGHPEFLLGGADRVTYSLFQKLRQTPGIEAVFVARVEETDIVHAGRMASYQGRPDEILWSTPPMDYFRLASADRARLLADARQIFDKIRPDIVHFGHILHIGTDLVEFVARELQVPSVLTFHEYISVCNNNGQMIKTNGKLCYAEAANECALCFPNISSGKFFLRKEHIMRQYAMIDRFIAPSPFLKERYAEWGLEADRIEAIGNIQPPYFEDFETTAGLPKRQPSKEAKVRFGFFGRINPYKGVDVLLRALVHLDSRVRKRLEIYVYGANLELEEPAFQEEIQGLVERNGDVVHMLGSYRIEDTIGLMRNVDWVVVPSIWWEIGPMVIEEAFAAGTPVLASNIAGMLEKITPGVNGEHFRVGSEVDLAAKITDIVNGTLAVSVEPTDVAEVNRQRFDAHLRIYRDLV